LHRQRANDDDNERATRSDNRATLSRANSHKSQWPQDRQRADKDDPEAQVKDYRVNHALRLTAEITEVTESESKQILCVLRVLCGESSRAEQIRFEKTTNAGYTS